MSEYDAKYIIKPIFNTTPIPEELLKLPPADGSTIPKELWKRGDNQLSVNENISLCKLRHGHWVETDTYPKCSVCGLYGVSDMNYCPHCGAAMDEVDE